MGTKHKTDVTIVGAGIVGLAHAYHAARSGLSVSVFERSAHAHGASTRNFGMLALVAQAEGRQRERALRSLTHWQEVAHKADIPLQQSGCLFLAREQEELQVLEEFVSNRRKNSSESLLSNEELARFNIDPPYLLGGAWSEDAWKLDQRSAVARLAQWLQREYKVDFYFDSKVTAISSIGDGIVEVQVQHSTNASVLQHTYRCGHSIICSGSEFKTLYPEAFAHAGVSHCELQMLRTVAQPVSWKLKPFVLGGLSITRYSAFESCAALPELVNLQRTKFGDYLKHGIHLIACQEADGSVTIGDSHQYGLADPLTRCNNNRSTEIDELLLQEAAALITLPDTQIAERWLGHYAHMPGHNPDNGYLTLSPASGVTSVTVTNGQGMTHGFALAEDVIAEITA